MNSKEIHPIEHAGQRSESARELALLPPEAALQNPDIACLLNHYIKTLALWYDLNDARRTFGTVIPQRALHVPVLFWAAIAFSSAHWFKITGKLEEISFASHAACVNLLLETLENFSDVPGEFLATVCLLRSYEILNESMLSPQYHLNGAFSLTSAINVDLSSWSLLQAGFWNYLREEITAGLVCRRRVRISILPSQLRAIIACPNLSDDMQANIITYLLACTMNIYFPVHQLDGGHIVGNWTDSQLIQWSALQNDLMTWKKSLPSSFKSFSKAPVPGNVFPSCWMLNPWHVSSFQYSSIAEILLILSSLHFETDRHLALERLQELALHVCGLAFTNDSVPARVNAFGPLVFCGQYLIHNSHRNALEAMLIDFSGPTGWPVKSVIAQLRDCWTRDC